MTVYSFVGADGAAWPVVWTVTSVGSGAAATIQSNKGRLNAGALASFGGKNSALLSGVTVANFVAFGVFRPQAVVEMYWDLEFRGNGVWGSGGHMQLDYSCFYRTDTGNCGFEWTDSNGGATAIGSTVNAYHGSVVGWRLLVVNSVMMVRFWDATGSEPDTWDLQQTDTHYTTGNFGIQNVGGSVATAHVIDADSVTVVAFSPTVHAARRLIGV